MKSESGSQTTRKARKTGSYEIPVDAIERRAHEKFVARGRAHGADLDDWRRAEEELATELAPRPTRGAKASTKRADAGAAQPTPKKRTAEAADGPANKSPAPRRNKRA